MDPMVLAAFVAFFALLIGCLLAPAGSAAAGGAGAQPGASTAD